AAELDEAVRRGAAECGVGRSRRGGIVRRADYVSRDFDVHDGRDVSGDGFDGGGGGKRDDGDDLVEPDRADAPGAGGISGGAERVAGDGDAVGAVDGGVVHGAGEIRRRAGIERRLPDAVDAAADGAGDFRDGAAGGGAVFGGADDDFAFREDV